MTPQPVAVRERARRAVQREIAEAAERLFAERGYDATTIEDVAAEVGMSARTLFRYFPTKEDLVVGKMDHVVDKLLAALRERPDDEPVWTSMRRMFDEVLPRIDGPGAAHETARSIDRMILETAALEAGYLRKLQVLEDAAERIVRERADAVGKPYAPDDPVVRSVVAAAFGCFLAAQRTWLAGDGSVEFAAVLDRAMAAITPALED